MRGELWDVSSARTELSYGDLWDATQVARPARRNGHQQLVARIYEVHEDHERRLPAASKSRKRTSVKDVTGFGLLEDAVDPKSIEPPKYEPQSRHWMPFYQTFMCDSGPVQPLFRYLKTMDVEGYRRNYFDLKIWLDAARNRGVVNNNGRVQRDHRK